MYLGEAATEVGGSSLMTTVFRDSFLSGCWEERAAAARPTVLRLEVEERPG